MNCSPGRISSGSLFKLPGCGNASGSKRLEECPLRNKFLKKRNQEETKKPRRRTTPAQRLQKGMALAYVGAVCFLCVGKLTVYAAGDPLSVVNNLSTFIFSLIRAIGLILLGLGIVQVGLSLKSHDPSQRANGFLTLAGGLIITFAKEILDLIMG